MKQFAETYTVQTISKFISFEVVFKNKDLVSQKRINQLLLGDSSLPEIVQQPVAQSEDDLFLQSILARISWSHHILINKERHLGRQVHFEISNSDFYADLLFYHTKLHCS